MNRTNAWKTRVGYSIFLATFTVLLGLLYIFECVDIYYSGVHSGGQIFSYDIVSQKMSWLIIPSLLWVVAIIGGYVVSALIPRVKKNKAVAPIKLARLNFSNKFIYATRLTVFVVAIVFIVLGIFNGGVGDVLMKAINICTECIGLG